MAPCSAGGLTGIGDSSLRLKIRTTEHVRLAFAFTAIWLDQA
jgi:hypothetical protein